MYYILYKTTNNVNGMIYIGQHTTNRLDDGYLGSGKRLRRAIKHYGRQNFSFTVLCYLSNSHELNLLERLVVNTEFLSRTDVYNDAIGGNGGTRRELHTNGQKIPIIQYDMEYRFIKEWQSIKDASRSLNLGDANISYCCKGKRASCGGFRFTYKSNIIKSNIKPKAYKRRVNQYDMGHIFIRSWDCIRDIERQLGIHNTQINDCVHGRQRTAHGFIWEYAD